MVKVPQLAMDFDGREFHIAQVNKAGSIDPQQMQKLVLDSVNESELRKSEPANRALAQVDDSYITELLTFNVKTAIADCCKSFSGGKKQRLALALPEWLFESCRVLLPKELAGESLSDQIAAEANLRFPAAQLVDYIDMSANVVPAGDDEIATNKVMSGSTVPEKTLSEEKSNQLGFKHYEVIGLKSLVADELMRFFQSAGIKLQSIEPRSWALQRSMQCFHHKQKQCYIVIAVESNQAVMLLTSGASIARHLLAGMAEADQVSSWAKSVIRILRAEQNGKIEPVAEDCLAIFAREKLKSALAEAFLTLGYEVEIFSELDLINQEHASVSPVLLGLASRSA